MRLRPFTLTALVPSFLAFSSATVADTNDPSRLVVQNDTYSSLKVSMVDGDGRETALGQAPPKFSNTLLVREPLPTTPVRLVARLVGEKEVLYRSDPVRLKSGATLRWQLPANRIETE